MKLSQVIRRISFAAAVSLGVAAFAAPGMAQPFKIGVSNAYVDTWRSQMLDTLNAANQELVSQGITEPLIVQSGTTNVQGQIAQIRALMNQGVDALLVLPASQTALNPVLEEAADQGIKVFAVTQEVSAPEVTTVMVDQAEWARIHARWLAEQLGGKGGVVVINGLAGAPANEMRFEAVKEVFAEHPDLKLLNAANGDWDQVKAQQAMSSILAAQPNLDGVWVSGAMSEGVLRAIRAANPVRYPIVTGDGNLGYLRLWKQVLGDHPDFRSVGVIDPPGMAATAALKIAVRSLQGDKINPAKLTGESQNVVIVPLPEVLDAEALDKVLADNKDKPDTYFLDVIATDETVAPFFD